MFLRIFIFANASFFRYFSFLLVVDTVRYLMHVLCSHLQMHDNVKASLEKQIVQLEAKLVSLNDIAKKKTLDDRYKHVKFFEKRKILRKMEQVKKILGRTFLKDGDDDRDVKQLYEQFKSLQDDLDYIQYFPSGLKYVSLFQSKDDPEVEKSRQAIRVKVKLLKNSTNPSDEKSMNEDMSDADAAQSLSKEKMKSILAASGKRKNNPDSESVNDTSSKKQAKDLKRDANSVKTQLVDDFLIVSDDDSDYHSDFDTDDSDREEEKSSKDEKNHDKAHTNGASKLENSNKKSIEKSSNMEKSKQSKGNGSSSKESLEQEQQQILDLVSKAKQRTQGHATKKSSKSDHAKNAGRDSDDELFN
jgi:hypothetical protein